MKIGKREKFNTPRKVVTLVRTTSEEGMETLSIRVRALPMGADQKMFELFPEPTKIEDWAKDIKGIILRDPETKKPLTTMVETPAWREANRKMTNGRLGYVLYHGIDDPDVDFDMEGKDRSKSEFYEEVFTKLVEFGFTMGDLSKLMGEIMGLMNLSEDVEAVKGN